MAYVSCNFKKVDHQIKTLSPKIEIAYKHRLINAVCASAEKHGVPVEVLVALLHVESGFRLGAVNSKTNDFGIAQVNEFNIKAFGINKKLLLTDLEYSIDKGAMILSWFHRTYSKRESMWYARYNVGTRKLRGALLKIYNRYGKKIQWRVRVYETYKRIQK
jgi:hypothetical protein